MSPLVLALTLAASASAQGGPVETPSTQDVIARMKALKRQYVLREPWTEANVWKLFGWKGEANAYTRVSGAFQYETPLPFHPLLTPLLDRFEKGEARKIADGCKAAFTDPWDQVGCVSRKVGIFFRGFKFDGTRSFCRSHAQGFDLSFKALGLPRSTSRHLDAGGATKEEGHVVNAVILTGDDGVVYSYAIDSGNFPGGLFPQNEAAMRRHDRDGDGVSESAGMPAIGRPGETTFSP